MCKVTDVLCNADDVNTPFSIPDAVDLAKFLTLDEFRSLQAETGAVFNEKRELIGPDGQPIDLSQFGQVLINPK